MKYVIDKCQILQTYIAVELFENLLDLVVDVSGCVVKQVKVHLAVQLALVCFLYTNNTSFILYQTTV